MSKDYDVSTRRLIITMLKTSGSLTVNEMAKQLGITEMAIRRHLNTLERDGLIESALLRQAVGRPTNSYSLTASAEDLFPKNYHHLALDLLQELDNDESQQGMVDKLFKKRMEKLVQKYKTHMEGKDLQDRVAALAKIQNDNGYMAEWELNEQGDFLLMEHNCPISQVANQFNHPCQYEQTLFETLLETKVERTECLTNDGKKCAYVIRNQRDA